MGLWIYDLDGGQVEKVLSGSIVTAGSWARDKTAMALDLGAPLYQIWSADLDPNTSTVAALGPGQTIEEHYLERRDYYTSIILGDPEDAENYYYRAQYYDCLQDKGNALADMDTYVALESQSKQIDTNDFWLHIWLVGLRTGTPTSLGSTVNSSGKDWAPNISDDNLTLYFTSERPDGHGAPDLYVTTRATMSDPWSTPVNLGPTVNSPFFDGHSCISPDGLSLLFSSTRSEGHGDFDIWVTTRESGRETWKKPTNLGLSVNSSSSEWGPSLSADGLSLFFTSNRPGGFGGDDIYVSTRTTTDDIWSEPVNLGPTVNSFAGAYPNISRDGLLLFFNSMAGGLGRADIWVTRRATKDDEWGKPVNLGPTVNSLGSENDLSISTDGSTLYFSSDRPSGLGRTDLWQLKITPISGYFRKVPLSYWVARPIKGKESKGGGLTRESVK
jgi:Tol biopolymer transport system component